MSFHRVGAVVFGGLLLITSMLQPKSSSSPAPIEEIILIANLTSAASVTDASSFWSNWYAQSGPQVLFSQVLALSSIADVRGLGGAINGIFDRGFRFTPTPTQRENILHWIVQMREFKLPGLAVPAFSSFDNNFSTIFGYATELTCIDKLNAVTESVVFNNIITHLQQALALPTLTSTNATNFVAAFIKAFNIAQRVATSEQCDVLSSLLTNVPSWLGSSVENLRQAIVEKKRVITETQLIQNLKKAASATKLSDITPYLISANQITIQGLSNFLSDFTNYALDGFRTAYNDAFNRAISLAASNADITKLNECLPPTTGALNIYRSPLTQALNAQLGIINAKSETTLIANLNAVTASSQFSDSEKFTDITILLTQMLKFSTITSVNTTNFVNAFVNAFGIALSIATLAKCDVLSAMLTSNAPSWLSSNVTSLQQAIVDRKTKLQKIDTETKIISGLKAVTTFEIRLQLLTAVLAPTYVPVNATELANTVVTAFTTAITAAKSLEELSQLGNLLKTPPAYISNNTTALSSALTQKQQQLQAATDAAAKETKLITDLKSATSTVANESTIIATLKSTKTNVTTLFSTLDTVLASTYKPGNLTNIKAAVLAGITRAIALITTSNYTTAQPKITNYISSATPQYLTAAQKASLSNSLKKRITSIRSSLSSAFISKVTSFISATTTAIATRTTPAATLAQRQAKLTSAIRKAAEVIDAHTQFAPSTSEQAKLKSYYTKFNAAIVKLIQDQGFIKKTVSGKTATYALAYGATATEPKASIKKVLNFMSTTSFPQLGTAQKNIITSINASIV